MVVQENETLYSIFGLIISSPTSLRGQPKWVISWREMVRSMTLTSCLLGFRSLEI